MYGLSRGQTEDAGEYTHSTTVVQDKQRAVYLIHKNNSKVVLESYGPTFRTDISSYDSNEVVVSSLGMRCRCRRLRWLFDPNLYTVFEEP